MSSFSSSENQESDSRSAPSHKWIHDVFVSFTKEDTGHDFVSDLYARLRSVGVRVFKDEMEPRSGDQILLQAIEGSKISIVVFSRNYANSTWCLQELEKIMECRKSIGQELVPVFYGVDPSEVRDQTGRFGEALARIEERQSTNKNKVFSYRNALKEAAAISGFVIPMGFRNRGEDIKKVVECVTRWVNRTNLPVATHPVGVQDGVQFLVKHLNKQKSDNVLLLGIGGMGGIGKTTFAKALYNQISCEFEGSSFLLDIRKAWQRERRASLQERILSDIFLTRERTIPDIKSGKRRLEERLHDKKVLLLLDDVNKREQVDALCGSREWFGPGSIIIITARDKRLLIDHRVDLVHTMEEMNESESTELFSWHAFKQASPRQDFAELCGNAVSYCGGLPLALSVLGSELFGKEMTQWKNVLDGLREVPHPVVQDALRISFDDLKDDKEKDLFLDISFFYIGISKEDVIHALKGYGDFVESGITVLEDRSLVEVDKNGEFGMHVLLREMGREILRELFRIEPGPMIYDVFLSFGADTRASFTSHLYTYLQNAGLHVFKDDESIQKGDQISISMMQAIGRSRISIVVLSEKYLNSRWCMMELEKILECRRTTNQQVLPVFYGVRPSEVLYSGVPSEKRSMFREAFEELLENISVDKDRELGWKRALVDISAIQGHVIANSWNESKDIKKVVADVTKMLNKKYLFVAEHPVGVESRVADVIQLLDSHQEKDILVLGIWGMGGAGKTTIAKATYNQIGANFEGRSFLLDVSKVWKETNGQVSLQKKLLSDIYQEMEIKIDNIEEGKSILQERLHQKKILLVLDDVNDQEQLNALYGSRQWFGPGSIIIITTRDKRLLIDHRVDHVHTMKEMDERESTELFSWHAFKQASPREDFADLCGNVVSYCGGLPLALCVLGSELFRVGEEMTKWKNELDRLREGPPPDVEKVLRISFDDLNDDKQSLFLDIAFFYIGINKEDVLHALKGYGDAADSGIPILEDRSLVKVENGKFGMHVLLREMGRKILRELFRINPGPMNYDVFLSFRADTRASFTSHLYTYLQNAGLHVFKGDESLQKGDQISISMMQAIARSRISIVVLSEKYPNSRWCMIELEKILECRRTTNQQVLPVFYGVTPSEVRSSGEPSDEKKSKFREAFEELLGIISGDKDRELGWKRALADISAIQGHPIANSWNESKAIKKIVADVTKMLNEKHLFVAEHPVEVESRVDDVIQLLDKHQEKDVLVLRSDSTSNIGDMAAEDNGIVSSTDDMATDINENASRVEDITADIVSGGDENR